MKIFCLLMDMCALNMYHVHRKLGGMKMWLMFFTELTKRLIEKYGRPHPAVGVGRPSESPKPSHISDTFLVWSCNNEGEINN
jgi:hypothetical protein